MTLDLNDFDRVHDSAKKQYDSLTSVWCPYLQQEVFFNTEGFRHIKFKTQRRARPKQDQYMRLKLVKYAPDILNNSKTLQGLWETRGFEKQRIHNRTDTVMVNITYYEFIAILEGKRIRVIVKKIDEGQCFFWSVIPHWRLSSASTREMHTGSPDID